MAMYPEAQQTNRRERHLAINDAIDNLSVEINGLEGLLRDIQGPRPECAPKTVGGPPVVQPSLSDFLNSGEERISILRDRVAKVTAAIRSELF